MKTIRSNCFETNSSSTHSFTVNTVNLQNKPDVTFIPDTNNEIHIDISRGDSADSATPQDKSAFLLLFADTISDQKLYDRIINIIETFTKAKVIPSFTKWVGGKNVTVSPYLTIEPSEDAEEDEVNENLADTFGYYVGEYGHGSSEEFKEDILKIVSTDESIKVFIFSSKQGVSTESHYDG